MTETEELADAECDLERWWTLAAVHPLEAEASPLYDLLTLEEPGRWGEMEKKKASSWMRTALPYLNERDKRLFACDCAERVLGYFEKVFPTDLRPREALHVARAFANGEATLAQLTSANANAETANDVAFSEDHAASQAANAITLAADPFDTKAPMYAADAAADVADYAAHAYHSERSWQWRRMREYLTGKVGGTRTKKHRVGASRQEETYDAFYAQLMGNVELAALNKIRRAFGAVHLRFKLTDEEFLKLEEMASNVYALLQLEDPELPAFTARTMDTQSQLDMWVQEIGETDDWRVFREGYRRLADAYRGGRIAAFDTVTLETMCFAIFNRFYAKDHPGAMGHIIDPNAKVGGKARRE